MLPSFANYKAIGFFPPPFFTHNFGHQPHIMKTTSDTYALLG